MAQPTPLMRGTLDLLILRALRWEPTHGAGVADWIRMVTAGAIVVEEGSLYPALRRLEQRGFVESEWGASDSSRRARYYQLTPRGRQKYWAEVEHWRRYAETMARVISHGTAGSIRVP